MKTVSDVMTRSVESITPDTPVREVAERMRSRNIGSLPVCDGRRLVGTITDRDITVRVTAEDRDPKSTRTSEVMSKELVTCSPDQDIAEAEQLMYDHQVRRLPVVDENRTLVGYLSLAKVARSEQDDKVIKGISEPRKPAPQNISAGSRGGSGKGGHRSEA